MTPFPTRRIRSTPILPFVFGAAFLLAASAGARAQEPARTSFLFATDGEYNEIESKYIFGFTEGSDIGLQGEMAVESETSAAFRRRTGRYMALEQEIEFEHVPTQNFAYELSMHGTAHRIKDDEVLGDKSVVRASGLSANLRYLLIGRGPGSPIGLTIMTEPEWSRVDGMMGTATRSLGTSFKIAADTEFIANRLYAAANLIPIP